MATIELNQSNFQQVIENNDIVLVDYWAPWCAPCRAFGPVFEKSSEKHPNMTFAKVNTQDEQELAAAFAIRSIPTLMIFRQKVLLFSQPGMLPAPALEELISKIEALDMVQVMAEIAKENASKSKENGAKAQSATA